MIASSFRPSILARPGILVLILYGACGSNDDRTATWAIDCVAVLGGPPVTAMTPLAAVPFSGAPREKYIAELSDAELGKFCDFFQCMAGNGYLYYCDETRLEAPAIMLDVVSSCRRSTPDVSGQGRDLKFDSRESCIDVFRRYNGRCRVGVYEDCARERATWPIAYYRAPSCWAVERECPL